MTIKDIALESGYAVGTVSRVLNNNPNVSAAARARILEVVRRHDFRPNANAKHLKQRSNSGIAIIVKGNLNMLFADILEKAQSLIARRGYASILYYIDEDANEVEQAAQICQQRKPYGLMFLGSALENFTAPTALFGVPAILVTNNATPLDLPQLSSVCVDDSAAASLMIETLITQGHREIGVIGGRADGSRPSRARLDGCKTALARHKLCFDPTRQYAMARSSLQGGYRAMEELLQKYPALTAVFTMSDLIALGAIRALRDHGLRVPEDISVTGYDGIALANYCTPRLTTIRQDSDQMAQRGVEILLDCIENSAPATHELIPFALLPGESICAR